MTDTVPLLCDLQNMDLKEVRQWTDDPRSVLAHTMTSRMWQSWLFSGEPIPEDLQREAAHLIWRYGQEVQRSGFRKTEAACRLPVSGYPKGVRKRTGYTRRHIALMNLGYNPSWSALGIDLTEEDQRWVSLHPGSADRRLENMTYLTYRADIQ